MVDIFLANVLDCNDRGAVELCREVCGAVRALASRRRRNFCILLFHCKHFVVSWWIHHDVQYPARYVVPGGYQVLVPGCIVGTLPGIWPTRCIVLVVWLVGVTASSHIQGTWYQGTWWCMSSSLFLFFVFRVLRAHFSLTISSLNSRRPNTSSAQTTRQDSDSLKTNSTILSVSWGIKCSCAVY